MRISYQIIVSGIVQGVGFRWFTKKLADQYALVGWVQNQIDGSVLIHVQGATNNMNSFLQSLSQGPVYGRVDVIKKVPTEPIDTEIFAIL